ncbi:hypothetical protein C8A01DRAFT_21586 [Parachaetomium inaequale]|uniref:Uncharacterized protein n=1 Tax=Parachaetomium inaequale TaxID=2588326 RepID=A0AAN6P3Z0_9PEZI|nr:hypothetical protein C8A01DRAFT_21586 [Parachaetomium inaequale]
MVSEPGALGKPNKPTLASVSYMLAVLVSLGWLALGILATTPTFTLAWKLGFQGQIVLVGLLLSIMNICTSVVLSSVFLLVEARFGPSRLQHYQAILTGKWTGASVSLTWRLVLVAVVVLPLALSVAYKQLLGGTAELLLEPIGSGSYGLDFPRIGSWTPFTLDSLYLLLNAFTPFWAAVDQGAAPFPEAGEFLLAYGYNTLLMDNDSAAVLDVPTTSYIAALQGRLSPNEVS